MLQWYYTILIYTYVTEEWREKPLLDICLDEMTISGQLIN